MALSNPCAVTDDDSTAVSYPRLLLPWPQPGNEEIDVGLRIGADHSGFADRASKLLRFLVERHMEGRDDELKESIIGVEAFGRTPDYDPKVDSTVRTEAVRLRARLNKYYSTEGSRDPMVIELPKRGYVPRYQPRAAGARQGASAKPVWLAVGLASLLVVATAAGMRWAISREAPVTIAVLPLLNLSENPGNDHFVDGLTDEIIRQASGITGFTVRSRTSSFALKRPRTVREAARQLNAEYIVDGSLTGSGPYLRITAQLVRVRDDVPLWAGRFDRHVTNILALQQEISRGIVNALQLQRMADVGPVRMGFTLNSPEFAFLGGDLRVKALRKQVGLPE
jgi:TolB-like protein